MKICKFRNCDFTTTDKNETLDEKHLYCPRCDEVVHLNLRWPTQKMSYCKCGATITEDTKTGMCIWEFPDGKVVCI